MPDGLAPNTLRPLPALPWRAVGVEQGKGSEWWYVFEVHCGREFKIRSTQMVNASNILALDSDIDRWRRMFPHNHRRGHVDFYAVAGMLVRECWAAQVRKDEAAKVNAQTADANGSQLKSLEHKDD